MPGGPAIINAGGWMVADARLVEDLWSGSWAARTTVRHHIAHLRNPHLAEWAAERSDPQMPVRRLLPERQPAHGGLVSPGSSSAAGGATTMPPLSGRDLSVHTVVEARPDVLADMASLTHFAEIVFGPAARSSSGRAAPTAR